MSNIVQWSNYNTLRFVRESVTSGDRYATLPADQLLYEDSVYDFQEYIPYKQKVQNNDPHCFAIYVTSGATATYQVIRCSDNKIVSSSFSPYYGLNSIKTEDGVTYDFLLFLTTFEDLSLADGNYYVRITVDFGSETKDYVCEPFYLKDSHDNTLLIEAHNETNRGDMIFIQNGDDWITPRPMIRFEGNITTASEKSKNNIFSEQDEENRNIKAEGWSSDTLAVGASFVGGAGHGVPRWLLDKINIYTTSDYWAVEGRRYTRAEDNTFEIAVDDKGVTRYVAELEVEPYDRDERNKDRLGTLIEVFTVPPYPFFIYETNIYNNGYKFPLSGNNYITNDTERDALVTLLNGGVSDFWGLNGSFTLDSGVVYYQNAIGESYTEGNPQILTSYFELAVTIASNNDRLTFRMLDSAYGGIVWGDSSTENYTYASPTTITNITHTYASSGSYTCRVFATPTTGSITCIRNSANFTEATITNITGDMPSGLYELRIGGMDFSGLGSGLDLSFLASCRLSIRHIYFVLCSISALDGNIFSSYSATGITGDSRNWALLSIINFNGNSFSLAELEAHVEDFYDHTGHSIPGFLGYGMSPQVTITNTPATTYITNLKNFGFTVQNP